MSRASFCGGAVTAACTVFCGVGVAFAVPSPEFFPVSDAIRVFEDGYACPASTGTVISVFGVRNETVSAQCAVRAAEAIKDLTVSVSPLTRRAGGASIPVENVGWNFVSGILILTNSPALKPADLLCPAPARFPDCLSDERRCDVPQGALKVEASNEKGKKTIVRMFRLQVHS